MFFGELVDGEGVEVVAVPGDDKEFERADCAVIKYVKFALKVFLDPKDLFGGDFVQK